MPQLASTYEILVGPLWLYYGDTGASFPTIDEDPQTATWTDMGETDGGATVTLGQSVEEHRTDQHTGPVKASRSEESVVIEISLVSGTLETLALAMENDVITTSATATAAGYKSLQLYRGLYVDEHAFLIRGKSAYMDANAQYEIPRGYIAGDLEREYVKDSKTLLPIEIHALEDLDATVEADRFGRLIMQTATATS